MLNTLIGALVGFALALIAEPIRQWLFRPRLGVEFGSSSEYQAETKVNHYIQNPQPGAVIGDLVYIGSHEAVYLRLKINNRQPGWLRGSPVAKGCRAYLINIEKARENGEFQQTIYRDSIPLAWSCAEPSQYDPMDIPVGVNQFVDVVILHDNSETYEPAIHFKPDRYGSLFGEQGKFRLTVQVSGENVEPVFIKIDLIWSGQWNKYEATEA